MSILLKTKLQLPPLPPKRVQRQNLIQRLNEGLESRRQITLVSAPAGFGKTICISEWVNGLEMPVTWLSLDASDDDPGRFFTYLIAALQKVNQSLGQEVEGVLRAGQLPSAETLSTTLVNDLLEVEERFLLVLDDFQVIQDPYIFQVLETLVNNLPESLYLTLLTREEPSLPLARLRASNQLSEIRARDLRFSAPEAAAFLNEVMGLSLSPEDIAALEERTEGWAVGLHLAGLSIQNQADPSTFIARLSGSHHYILSYLMEEVFNGQPVEIQVFLLQTAILDRLSGELCNAVTGRTDSQAMLEGLLAANLFLIPLDDEYHWYRYHQLFADLLGELQSVRRPANLAELHQRASRWYAQAGLINEAIQHALAAGDFTTAVHLIESHAMDMLMQWHLKTVEGWMRAIPTEWFAQSAQANLAFAWMHLMRGNPALAAPYLQQLPEIFSATGVDAGDPVLEAKWLALQAMLLNAQGKPAESLQLASQALEMVPSQEAQVRSMIYLGLAGAYQQLEDYSRAMQAYQEIIQLGEAVGNSIFEMQGISGLALLALQHGQYHYAFELTSRGIEKIERSGSLPPISTAVYGELGVIYYQWHQLEQAHRQFLRAIQVGNLSGYSDAEIYYGMVLSRLFQIQGNLEAASKELNKVLDLMQVNAPAAVREEVLAQQVRLALAQGHLAEAEAVLKSQGFTWQGGFVFRDSPPSQIAQGVLYTSALRILLHRFQVHADQAGLASGIELASRLIDEALQHQYLPFALETLLLRAQMHAALGDDVASRADFTHALRLGEPEGLISIFLEEGQPVAGALVSLLEQNQLQGVQPGYVRDIIAAFAGLHPSETPPPAVPALIEPLTERELDVLRLIAEGLKYGEIAERLFVSLNTVRTHIKAIYGKLGVNNRTQAILLASQLQLI